MYVARRVAWRHFAPFALRSVVFFITYSTAICALYAFTGWPLLTIPFVPIATIGTAVAFYVGFKNNSAYDRLWEGRRIWGSIVNASRSWSVMVHDFITDRMVTDPMPDEALREAKKKLIYGHLAYLTALRIQLRRQTVWQQHRDVAHDIVDRISAFKQCSLDVELQRFLPDNEIETVMKFTNPATQLLRAQSARLRDLRDQGYLSDFYHVEMERSLTEFYNQQGACERIKSFPFPRQYAFFSYVFTWVFIWVLPYGILNEMAKVSGWHLWLTVPFYTIIAWVFNTMEVVGDTSENPFENSINDVPLTAICRNIEIDLRETLDETNVPKRVQAVENILM